MADSDSIKLCECGCGQPAPIAKQTSSRFGHIRGQPVRFIAGHHNKHHGHTGEGWQSPTYKSWIAMRLRCENNKHVAYRQYGARGITVCGRWRTFANFLADMGERPSREYTLDRYPNKSGNYEPGNVRWATKIEQANNMVSNRLITALGETHTVAEWARKIGLTKCALLRRLKRWSPAEALTRVKFGCEPVCKHGHPRTTENIRIFVDKSGRTRRACRACNRNYLRDRYARHRQSSKSWPIS